MTTSIANQIVLITGASSGIGASCARFFAEAGARLILAARRKEKLQALAEALQGEYSVDTLLLPLDVQDAEAVSLAIEGLACRVAGH
jgi:3-hydroxy acid dehydrogenase/malonic semialdehyde reductase